VLRVLHIGFTGVTGCIHGRSQREPPSSGRIFLSRVFLVLISVLHKTSYVFGMFFLVFFVVFLYRVYIHISYGAADYAV